MSFLFNQLALAIWNYLNSFFDAYRILKNKSIAHGINFAAYVLYVAAIIYVSQYDIKTIALFSVSAFFNRQFSFDLPLNLRRHLKWYYQSTANPPKSLTDRVERLIFGNHPLVGIKIAIVYWVLYGNIIALYYYSK